MSDISRQRDELRGMFSHERLDVYGLSIELARWVYHSSRRMASGRASLRDQMLRASESIVLNIAEGAQQASMLMARKHYRIALCSAAELASVLDLLEIYEIMHVDEARRLVNRIGAMLRKLSR